MLKVRLVFRLPETAERIEQEWYRDLDLSFRLHQGDSLVISGEEFWVKTVLIDLDTGGQMTCEVGHLSEPNDLTTWNLVRTRPHAITPMP